MHARAASEAKGVPGCEALLQQLYESTESLLATQDLQDPGQLEWMEGWAHSIDWLQGLY